MKPWERFQDSAAEPTPTPEPAAGPWTKFAGQKPAKPASTPTPANFPKMSGTEQRERDFVRYGLLRSEESGAANDPNLQRELADMDRRYPDFRERHQKTQPIVKAATPPAPKFPQPQPAQAPIPSGPPPQAGAPAPTPAPAAAPAVPDEKAQRGAQYDAIMQKGTPLNAILEPLLAMLTGGTTGMAGGSVAAITDKQAGEKREDAYARGADALTYSPKSDYGKAGMAQVEKLLGWLQDTGKMPAALPELFGLGGSGVRKEKWERPPTVREGTVADLMDKGYTMPPMEGNPSTLNNLLQGMGGKVQSERAASRKNVDVIKRDAARALELPPETELTVQRIKDLRAGDWRAPYIAMDTIPRIVLDDQAVTSDLWPKINDVTNPGNIPGPMGNHPRVQSRYITGKDAAEGMQQLRADANDLWKQYRKDGNPETKKSAKAHSKALAELESQVDRYLKQHGHEDLLDQLQHSRTLYARSYTVENALNDATGEVDARKVLSGDKATRSAAGPLKNISDAAELSRRATQSESTVGATPDISPLGIGAATISNNPTRAIDYLLLRPLITRLINSPGYQDRFVRPDLTESMRLPSGPPYAENTGALGAIQALMADKRKREEEGRK